MRARSTASGAQDRVGVRELRQNLSVYLERVVAGETLQVTDRGQPVAMLVPLPRPERTVQRLVASGRALAASGDLLDLAAPPGRASRRLSEALQDVREDRR